MNHVLHDTTIREYHFRERSDGPVAALVSWRLMTLPKRGKIHELGSSPRTDDFCNRAEFDAVMGRIMGPEYMLQ